MTMRAALGLLAALSVAGLVGCGSSSTTVTPAADTGVKDTGKPTPADVGKDAPTPVEGGPDTTPVEEVDKTTGKPCKKATGEADCDPTGRGINKCTDGLYSVGSLYATSVCVGVDSADVCDPGDGKTIPLCDGGTGLCEKSDTNPSSCEPLCVLKLDGTFDSPKCAGNNPCEIKLGAADEAGKTTSLIGTCTYLASCNKDSDCPTGNKCDDVQKLCLKTCTDDTGCKLASSPSFKCDKVRGHCTFVQPKKPGDACKTSDDCLCFKNTADTDGYCISMCRTGTDGMCAAGSVCDTLLTKSADLAFAKAPAGLFGYCTKSCTADSGCIAGQVCLESAGMGGVKTCRPKPTTP